MTCMPFTNNSRINFPVAMIQGRDTQVADTQSGSPAGVVQSGVSSDIRNVQSYDVEDEVSPSSYYSSDNSQTSSALGRIIEYVN
jgi:hypothetical protein